MPHRIIRSWYTGRSVGCDIWYSEEGTGRRRSPPRPLRAVPNVTAHPSTASVPITDGPLLCGLNVAIKGLNSKRKARALRNGTVLLFAYADHPNYANYLFVCLSPTRTCRAMARMAQQRNNAGGRKRPQRCSGMQAAQTTGVPVVSFPFKNFTLVKFTIAAGAYS